MTVDQMIGIRIRPSSNNELGSIRDRLKATLDKGINRIQNLRNLARRDTRQALRSIAQDDLSKSLEDVTGDVTLDRVDTRQALTLIAQGDPDGVSGGRTDSVPPGKDSTTMDELDNGVVTDLETRRLQEAVYSKDFFPEKTKVQIDAKLQQLQEIYEGLQLLKGRLITDRDKIDPVVRRIREISIILEDKQRGKEEQTTTYTSIDYETINLQLERGSLYSQISEYTDQLNNLKGYNYDPDIRCRELVDVDARTMLLRRECMNMLGIDVSTIPVDDSSDLLVEQVERDQNYLNGKNIMSHVTGYRSLVNILLNGNLVARRIQANQGRGEVVSSFKEKGDSEDCQIVFDKFTIRSSYVRGKDKEGFAREDPIIIMMRSRDLMTGYQYMESDGFHFFGINHDDATAQSDPFRAEAGNQNMAILVPSI